ncbi:putative plastid-lipid-associated protein 6, chloroplastic [Panicum miliaceum]|uniref:Plastid-lipid-associated protein 6, chloroplastic n=1 Tax=Panicum miliaceum TaxID=4540 RepID=A0A3L6PLF5_PANMI|nr:putative plastid-lipid-associated protein 6, chloroplastic [Panicum miliaceum]
MAMAAPWSSPPSSSCCAATASTSAPRLLGPGSLKGAAWPAGAGGSSCGGQGRNSRRRLSVRATAAAPPPPVDYEDTSATGADADYVASLKVKLLSAVSGLNRGLAASQEDLDRADAAARELEAAGDGPVDLSRDLDRLQGRWRLVYSSAFSSRTLGGSRPGPPTGRLLPITLGQVFQRIDVVSRDFDNIVELELGAPWPLPPVEATATLAHKFEIVGTSGIKINFEKTTVKTKGSLSQLPPLEVPRIPDNLRPPSNTGSGEFEVTYLDGDTRVTRGDRGELRVFVVA